jgi:multiple sugar transport system permease protein
MTRRIRPGKVLVYAILVGMSVASLFPFVWLIRSSLMSSEEIFAMPLRWIPSQLRFENFHEALTAAPFDVYFKNTLIVVGLNIIGSLFSASFAAFGFARINFTGRNFLFGLVLSTMMIPATVLLIPQFFGWRAVGAYDTLYPLIVPAFFINGFFIFLLKQFFSTIPREYDEAAFIDGANYLQIYAQIMLPLSKPALMTVGVFTFMWNWNDFFGPLIYLSSREHYTLALGLQTFIGQYTTQWHYLMAASLVVVLPMILLFFFAQRAFIEGIAFSGLKG